MVGKTERGPKGERLEKETLKKNDPKADRKRVLFHSERVGGSHRKRKQCMENGDKKRKSERGRRGRKRKKGREGIRSIKAEGDTREKYLLR